MRPTVLLADFAQADQSGKVAAIGLGWAIRGPVPGPMSVVVLMECPWDQTNKKHTFRLELLDADGNPQTIPTPLGPQPVLVEGEFESGRPPGIPEGTPISGAPLVVNLPPIPLEPGRYEFKLSIDGEAQHDWHRSFLVAGEPRPPQ